MKNAIFETPHNEIKCVLSIKESNFKKNGSKFSHLLTVRAKGAAPPTPLYGQPDHKIVVFLTIGLIWFEENLMELQFIGG